MRPLELIEFEATWTRTLKSSSLLTEIGISRPIYGKIAQFSLHTNGKRFKESDNRVIQHNSRNWHCLRKSHAKIRES